MRKILTSGAGILIALLLGACADKDPRIGELLNVDPSTNPNISIAYLKNAEAPYSSVSTSARYLLAENKFEGLDNGISEIAIPVQITKPIAHDITIELVADESKASEVKNLGEILQFGEQITSKVSKVTIKAGALTSEEKAVFAIDLNKLDGTDYVFPVTLKVDSSDANDCIVSQNFGSMNIRLNISYSLEGLLEMDTKVDPSLAVVTDVEHLKFGTYQNFDASLFDNNLETATDNWAYYDALMLHNINDKVAAFSIQPKWDASAGHFIEMAKAFDVIITDMNNEEQIVGRFTLPDFSTMAKEDNPMLVFKLKKPMQIEGISLRDVYREDNYYREIAISEFRLYK